MKNTKGLKVGDIVEMASDWGVNGRPRGSRFAITKIHDFERVYLEEVVGYEGKYSRYHVAHLNFTSHAKRNLKDFYEKY